jgi:hypothetical protein
VRLLCSLFFSSIAHLLPLADYIDASLSDPSSSTYSSRLISSLRRYGPSQPSLYPLVLRHLTSTASLLSRHQPDVLDLLNEVDEQRAMVPIEVVRVLSEGGIAGLAVVSEYLKRQLTREKEEIDSVRSLSSLPFYNSLSPFYSFKSSY